MIADEATVEATVLDPAAPSPRRTAWIAARARNAAKRGVLIAAVGVMAVAATVLVLIIVPREVDQAIRAQIAALPPLADTTPFVQAAMAARAQQKSADSTVRKLQYAAADRVAGASRSASHPYDGGTGAGGAGGSGDGKNGSSNSGTSNSNTSNSNSTNSDERRELGMRIARARSVPLVESFRAIGEAEFLRDDVRIHTLLDSLDDVNKQRDAYAALSGPDARYAALTARLASIGQQLTTIAEQRLANSTSASSTVADSSNLPADTATLSPRVSFNVDSVAERVATAWLDSANARVVSADQALSDARKSNSIAMANRARAEAQSTVNVPAVAMLLAALVLGSVIGYGVAFVLEVRRPRIADVAEVEWLTGARVIVHGGASRAATRARHRRESDEALFPVIDTVSEAYKLLHVTITGFGDTAHSVRVIGDSAMVSATVGINLAAAAAREARATLLIDADAEAHLATSLLHVTAKKGVAESVTTPDKLRSRIVRTKVGRNQYINTLFAGKKKTALPEGDQQQQLQQSLPDELQLLSNEHDLTVILAARDSANSELLPLAGDAILCVRLRQTKLDWLVQAATELHSRNVRLRAVLLWAAAAPRLK